MEISRVKSDQILVLRLVGRLDATWCHSVQQALGAAVRDGEHRLHLDMAQVSYVSSAGLRVLLSVYKQLRSIRGELAIVRASAIVQSTLELAGLEQLTVRAAVPPDQGTAEVSAGAGRTLQTNRGTFEIHPVPGQAAGGRFTVSVQGDLATLHQGAAGRPIATTDFDSGSFALGVGALGANQADYEARFGEFLAVAGCAAFQPADGSSRPDFVVSQGALVPQGALLYGLSGVGSFPVLARFEAKKECRTVPLSELAETALVLAGTSAVAFVMVAEASGLVGATLRRSPAPPGKPGERFGFPQIRDWLSFTSERAFRETAALVVGIAARPGTALDPMLRPLGQVQPVALRTPILLGHAHAAVFPYRPLRKGLIDLRGTVTELFDGHALQAVLHLLADPREFNGAGDSEFTRGALWLAPIAT